MLKQIWKKLLALNTGVVLTGIALFSRNLIGLQFSTGTAFSKTLSIFIALAFLVVAIFANIKIVFSSKNNDKRSEEKVVEESKRLKNYTVSLRDYSKERPHYRNLIERAILQINSFNDKKASLDTILKRNNVSSSLVTSTINSVEAAIASNMRVFLNFLEISHEHSNDDVDVESPLNANASILKDFDKLLSKVAKMNGKAKIESHLLDLKTTNEALEQSSRMHYPEQSQFMMMKEKQ